LEDDLDRRNRQQINKAQIKTFVKTGGKPFIPGSSIKGAIRTALAYHILKEVRREKVEKILDASVKLDERGGRKFVPGERDAVEKYLLRADDDIDEDILMLLGITDSAAVEADRLVVVRGKRLASRSSISTGYYEALRTGTKTTFRVFFNEFGDGVQRRRDASLIPTTPQELFAILNEFARDLIDFEKRQKRGDQQKYLQDFDRIIKFCDNLEAKMRDNPNAGFMALGWGTGWHSKTVGILLNKDPEKFLRMMRAYEMGRPPGGTRGNWKPDPAFFPKTREVIVEAREPLFGWVMLRLKED
jgi:CRISPR-associated protein Csm5